MGLSAAPGTGGQSGRALLPLAPSIDTYKHTHTEKGNCNLIKDTECKHLHVWGQPWPRHRLSSPTPLVSGWAGLLHGAEWLAAPLGA